MRIVSKKSVCLVATVGVLFGLVGCGSIPAAPEGSALKEPQRSTLVPQSADPQQEQPSVTAYIETDGPSYESVEELARNSVAIVTVDILGSESALEYPSFDSDDPMINPYAGTGETPSREELEAMATPVTLHRVTVTAVAGGSLRPGDEIVILELGGVVDGVDYEIADMPSLSADQLLFLDTTPKGRYFTVGGGQGRFNPDGKGGFVSALTPTFHVSQANLLTLDGYLNS